MSPEKHPETSRSLGQIIFLAVLLLILGAIILYIIMRLRNNSSSSLDVSGGNTATPAEIAAPEPTATPTAALTIGAAKEGVNVYSGPATVYELIGRLEAGAPVTILQRNEAGNWLKVALAESEHEAGWVAADFIDLSNEAMEALAITLDIPPTPIPQSCPVRLTGPPDGYIFTSADEVQLTWASAGPLEADHTYRLSFRDLDGKELDALLTTNPFSIKAANPDLVRWPRDNGEWLADIGENASYKWSVAVVAGDSLLCEAEEVWTISWDLP